MANESFNSSDQFDDLRLPDMDDAWQKMNALLDKKDDERKPFFPVSLRSCALTGLLLIFLGGIAWFTINHFNEITNVPKESASTAERESGDSINSKPKENNGNIQKPLTAANDPVQNEFDENSQASDSNTDVDYLAGGGISLNDKHANNSPQKNNSFISQRNRSVKGQNKIAVANQSPILLATNIELKPQVRNEILKNSTQESTSETDGKAQVQLSSPDKNDIDPMPISNELKPVRDTEKVISISEAQDSVAGKLQSNVVKNDTSKQTMTDSTKVLVAASKSKQSKKGNLIFSAGLGLHQQILIGDQTGFGYNYYGKQSTFSDHIPSVYIRIEKDKKWFVQGEFRYSAPQALNSFSYNRKTSLIDSGKTIATTHSYLKKTYYHQLPLSFNYYVLPKLSLGAGAIFNMFHGAITEKEIRWQNINSQQESLAKEVLNIKQFNDSYFYKSQIHLLLQAEYQWKRFSFGLRYTSDLQPYIKFTMPDGEIVSKKNQALQGMIRFRLWKSK